MVKLYVSLGRSTLYCGSFKNELAALKWFETHKNQLLDHDGDPGTPITVTSRRT